jgi:hypothetical protein
MATTPDRKTIQLLPLSETEYFIDGIDIQISFIKNEKGIVENAIVHQSDNNYSIKKIE